jgi:hypothetical protein
MRNMSFMLTPDQILDRSKTVTRRLGWSTLEPGTLVRAVRKGMGLKRGEKVEQLAIIRITDVTQEPLTALLARPVYGMEEVHREGLDHRFQGSPAAFVAFFCASHRGCEPASTVTRIEFEYV